MVQTNEHIWLRSLVFTEAVPGGNSCVILNLSPHIFWPCIFPEVCAYAETTRTLSAGVIAAIVIVIVLIIIAVIVAVLIYFYRKRKKRRQAEWEALNRKVRLPEKHELSCYEELN